MSDSNVSTSTPDGQWKKSSQGVDADYQGQWWNKICKYISIVWFMASYYSMLIVCLGILVYILVKGAGSSGNSADKIYSLEVTSGIILGLFSILATFTVVFFALRAEEAATNSSSSVVQEIVNKTFNDEERAIAKALRDAGRNVSGPAIIENESDAMPARAFSLFYSPTPKRDSIYFGVDKCTAQFFIWISIFLVMIFLGYIVCNFLTTSRSLDTQSSMALSIGILGVLVTLTVILFALRAARFSQIAGRIASYSIIERMAASHEQKYHKLLDTFLALLVQEKLLVAPKQYHDGLIDASDKILNPSEQKEFNLCLEWEKFLLYRFSFLLALSAVFTTGCFIFFVERPEFIGLNMNLILILFVFLISLTTLFFSGRVVLSAIRSSEIQATEMTCVELERQKNRLHDRIISVEGIKKALKNYLGAAPKAAEKGITFEEHEDVKDSELFEKHVPPLLITAKQKIDDQIKDIVKIRMHLRYLRVAGVGKSHNTGENYQFRWICNYLEKLWTKKFEEMDSVLFVLQKGALPLKIKNAVIRGFSKARQEDRILMKLQQEQMKQQNLMLKSDEKENENILSSFWKVSLLRLNFDENTRSLMQRWEKIEAESSELDEQYAKEVTSTNLSLEELKKYRKAADFIFHLLLFIIRLELTITRLRKVVSNLPHSQTVEKIGKFHDTDWGYVKFLQELNPVFLDTRGPSPILTDYHLGTLEEIKRAPELFEILHRNNQRDLRQSS